MFRSLFAATLELTLVTTLAAEARAHDWNGFVADRAGNLFAVDGEDGFIWKITQEGIASAFVSGKPAEELHHPHHLEIDGDDRLWVAGGCNSGLIWRIDPAGTIQKIEWPMPKAFELETVVPDHQGKELALWVVTPTQILRLTLKTGADGTVAGEKLAVVAAVGSPDGAVARAADGALLLANGGCVKRVTRKGAVTDVIDVGAAVGEIFGLALAGDGSLRLADWEHGRLLQFKEGVLSELATGLEHPSGLVLTKDGVLLVKESGRQSNTTGRIRRVGADGKVTLFAELRRDGAR